MRNVAIIILVLVLVVLVRPSLAVEVSIFGPTIYERTKGKPAIETNRFSISGLSGTGQFIIRNGGSDKKGRVSNGEIWFNGSLIFGQNDFNKNVEYLMAEVPLLESNTISVKLNGQPGSSLTATIWKFVDAEAATVVGPEGGEVYVTDPDSRIFGAGITVPQGALNQNVIISIRTGDTMGDAELVCVPLLFEPDGIIFQKEAQVVFPLKEIPMSDDVLILMELNSATTAYEFADKLFKARAGDPVVIVWISHFSSYSLKEFTSTIPKVTSVIDFFDILSQIKEAFDTNNCVELSSIKDSLRSRQDEYWNTMQAFIDGFEWCTTRPGCETVKDVGDALLEIFKVIREKFVLDLIKNAFKVIAEPVSVQFLDSLKALDTAFKIGVYGACDLCLMYHSIINPEFLIAFWGYNISEYGIQLIINLDSDGDGIVDACEGLQISLAYRYPITQNMNGIALSPDDSTLYLAYWTDTSNDRVEWYSTEAPYGFVNYVAYGRCHADVVVSANNRYIFTTSYYQSNVSRFDLWNNRVRTSLPTTSWPGNLSLTPDRSKMVVFGGMDGSTNMTNDALIIFDVRNDNFSELARIGLSDFLVGDKMAFTDNGDYGYFLTGRWVWDGGPAKLHEVSLGSYTVTDSVLLPSQICHDLVLASDKLYVSDWDNSMIRVYDRQSLTEIDEWPLSHQPTMLAVPPDSSGLYVLLPNAPGRGALEVHDLSSGNKIGGYPELGCGGIQDFQFNSDGSKLYIACPPEGVIVLDVNAN